MEYLIGSLVTLAVALILSKNVVRTAKRNIPVAVRFSQSYNYELIRPLMPFIQEELRSRVITQAKKHYQKTQIRVLFVKDEAYWISNNSLYVASLIDGIVDENSAKIVDTMTMDKVELDKVTFIVEQLTEGLINDSGDSGI